MKREKKANGASLSERREFYKTTLGEMKEDEPLFSCVRETFRAKIE